jgi:HemY protein
VGAALAERQLWGKAREPLETAANHADLPIATRRMAWLTLAQIAHTEGNALKEEENYRKAAMLG